MSVHSRCKNLMTIKTLVAVMLLISPVVLLELPFVRAASARPAGKTAGRFAKEIAAFADMDARNAWPDKPMLFVGSSSIRLWKTREAFPDLPVINRGFGGSHIADVNHYFDRIVKPYEPSLIVLYAGDNDVAAGKSPEQVEDDFKTFAALVEQHLPQTQVIYLAIKISPSRAAKWLPRMLDANERIHRRCDAGAKLTYVDVAQPMLEDRIKPRAAYYREDGLHLNDRGYALWKEILEPVVRRVYVPGAAGP